MIPGSNEVYPHFLQKHMWEHVYKLHSYYAILQYTWECCRFGMFIPDPDFYQSRIPDPATATKEEENFFVAANKWKIKII